MFKEVINRYIESKKLFNNGDKLLVALSGGADSVALLHVLLELGYECEAAHCNFHLRGKESDRDENFVRNLCKTLNVKLHVIDFDTTLYAQNNHVSIEMAARELRYNWFEKLRIETDSKYIAIAHHRDDSVETFILNLVRGAGINGLKGISPKNGYIVRPLLNITRHDIQDYLEILKQEYVTDSTNLQDEYMRNKIRLNVLPLLSQLNPSVSEKIAETSQILGDVALIYNDTISKAKQEVVIDNKINISRLQNYISPVTLLFEILYPLGFNSNQIDDIYCSIEGQPGKRFYSSRYELVRDRDYFMFYERDSIDSPLPELDIEYLDIDSSFIVPKDKRVCCIDADKVKGKLTIRRCENGDKFVPFGMKGQKKLSDYMTDKKFSLIDKKRQCVVCDGDRIVWLVNERTDDRFKITSSTKRVMIIKVK